MLSEIIITKEIIGIIGLFITLIGVALRLNSRIDKLEFRADAIEEATNTDRMEFKRTIEKLNGDLIHLEKNIGQMQTNIRIFIQEQGREMTEQMDKLHDKIDHLKEQHYNFKIEIAERLK